MLSPGRIRQLRALQLKPYEGDIRMRDIGFITSSGSPEFYEAVPDTYSRLMPSRTSKDNPICLDGVRLLIPGKTTASSGTGRDPTPGEPGKVVSRLD